MASSHAKEDKEWIITDFLWKGRGGEKGRWGGGEKGERRREEREEIDLKYAMSRDS